MGLQVSVALFRDQVLARRFPVVRVDFVDHVHTVDDGSEGSEAHAVEASVVSIVDKELGCARIGAGGRKHEVSSLIALNDGIILDFGVVPGLVDGGVRAESELHNEAGNNAKERRVGEVAIAHQVVKAVCAERRPVPMHFDNEVARTGGELCFEDRGRLEL